MNRIRICCDRCLNQYEFDISELKWVSAGTHEYELSPSCPCCGNITENELCDVCSDDTRNHRLILVVESIKDLFTIEKINEYQGIYHVLNGAIEKYFNTIPE